MMTIQAPVIGKITQGTIFCCASAERYPGLRVFGIAITARCDVANDKFPVLNYLPLVSLPDFFHCDGWELIYSRATKSAESSFLNTIQNHDISPTILYSKSHREIVESFFQSKDAAAGAKKSADRASGIVDEIELLSGLRINSLTDRNLLLANYKKLSDKVIQELVEHKLTGFYYLPPIDEIQDQPMVALLRESTFMPRELAKAVAGGVDRARAPLCNRGASELDFSFDEFAMPVGQLTSPNIEHLLQNYSQMFGRIGVADTPKEVIERICALDLRKGAL